MRLIRRNGSLLARYDDGMLGEINFNELTEKKQRRK